MEVQLVLNRVPYDEVSASLNNSSTLATRDGGRAVTKSPTYWSEMEAG